jgi:hypothetical protein
MRAVCKVVRERVGLAVCAHLSDLPPSDQMFGNLYLLLLRLYSTHSHQLHINLGYATILIRNQACFSIYLIQANQAVQALLKGIVVADHDELVETTNAADLIGQVHTPQFVHILGGLVCSTSHSHYINKNLFLHIIIHFA